MTLYACNTCGAVSDRRWCTKHRGTGKDGRPSPIQRGYGQEFLRNRARLLASHPACCEPGCDKPAVVADHVPARRVLVARGVENPDALEWLHAMCIDHHNQKAARGE